MTRVSPDGRKLTFRHLFPGDMLGEECLVKPCERMDYAETMEPAVLCQIRAEDFRRLAAKEVEFSNAISRALCRRIDEVEQVLADTVFGSVRRRIASGLLRLYGGGGSEEGVMRVTHQEIANLVGSTRETTTAVLHAFREDGIVQIANRQVTVLDPTALERLSLER